MVYFGGVGVVQIPVFDRSFGREWEGEGGESKRGESECSARESDAREGVAPCDNFLLRSRSNWRREDMSGGLKRE